jgi:hypothetical protein
MGMLAQALADHRPWALIVALLPPVWVVGTLWVAFLGLRVVAEHGVTIEAAWGLGVFVFSPLWPALCWCGVWAVES